MEHTNKKSLSILSKNTITLGRVTSTFVTVSECKKLLANEGWVDALDVDSYTVFCCLNTWCSLFQDITGNSGSILSARLRLNGLKRTIEEADDFRLQLVHDAPNENSFWSKWTNNVVSAETLTLLGFPRRLRIVGKTATDETEKFIRGNRKAFNHNKYYDIPATKAHTVWKGYWENNAVTCKSNPHFSIPSLYSEQGSMTKDEWLEVNTFTPPFLVDEASRLWNLIFKDWKQDTGLFTLPPGVTVEGARTYLEKFEIVCLQQMWLREHGVNLPTLPANTFTVPRNWCSYSHVPKTFKSLRGIAPEAVSRQVLGYQVDSGMRSCLKRLGVDLTNQDRNRYMSSRWQNFATEDMSAASDSISLWLVDNISKGTPCLHDQLMACRSDFVLVDGKLLKNHRFATMGNAVTFATESVIFLILCLICYELHNQDYIRSFRRLQQVCLENFAVYGDDCVIPNNLHDLFVQIAERFGFKVNTDKSFWDIHLYRESCGAEWYNGQDVTGTYWPRGLSNVPLAELVSLQHKLVAYPTTNSFLVSVILDVFPDITQSEIGSPYQDIWCDDPCVIYKGHSPYARFAYMGKVVPDEKLKDYCSHLQLKDRIPKAEWCEIDVSKPIVKRSFRQGQQISVQWIANARDLQAQIELRRVLISVDCPHDDNYEVHTTIGSKSGGEIKPSQREKVELLSYLLKLGGGLEHINSSAYTKPTDAIIDRRDLVHKRKVQINNRRYVL